MITAGDVVVCSALECRPHLLVLAADGPLETALLADLARESIQRLHYGEPATVVQAVQRADDIATYHVPTVDVAPAPAFGGAR
ncbi:hypothetical protein [Haloarcula salinisoli]|uniref:Uncharacterized protein n=1 Tax=Haloarcula salinisoli TaxID=2487746 RepID=A0A8J7YMW4_9EURY|nr:hypothetical protein [Halomicroarcula salinisoli]MBX0305704.1 hypothetical protein [Halomicroarcula salinisoli]